MERPSSARKCRCCNELLKVDYRNGHSQRYCSRPGCRRASKAESQKRWLAKAANRDYFRGRENVQRVQTWRKTNPGYWKKRTAPSQSASIPMPDGVKPGSPLVTQPTQSSLALQDICITDPVFIGLISMVTGSTLQEDIASTARRLEARGRDILGLSRSGQSPIAHDYKTSDST